MSHIPNPHQNIATASTAATVPEIKIGPEHTAINDPIIIENMRGAAAQISGKTKPKIKTKTAAKFLDDQTNTDSGPYSSQARPLRDVPPMESIRGVQDVLFLFRDVLLAVILFYLLTSSMVINLLHQKCSWMFKQEQRSDQSSELTSAPTVLSDYGSLAASAGFGVAYLAASFFV